MAFHDDAVNFISDLLKKLETESKSEQVGPTDEARESATSTLLRLLGVLESPDLKVGEAPAPGEGEDSEEEETQDTLFDSFFKVQTRSTEVELQTINRLLKSYKSRLTRYSRARSKIKLNRIKRLVDDPKNPVDTDELIQDTPEETRREVSKKLQEIQEEGDITGILQQEIDVHTALTESIDSVVNSLPTNVGSIRSQLVSLLRATGKESFDAVEQLTMMQTEFQKESDKLENMDKLLFEGQETFAGSSEKLSLLQVLDVLIFLTDRQQMKYQCSQCKFFQPGKTNACLFAAQGNTAKTASVTVPNDQGELVSGRLTQPTNSCKQVWGLDSNEYFAPSESIIESLENTLKGGE